MRLRALRSRGTSADDQYSVCPLVATCSRRSSSSAGELPAEPWAESEASVSPRQSGSTAQLSEREERTLFKLCPKTNSYETYLNMTNIKQDCTWVTAESWSSAASPLWSTGSSSGLAGGEQVVLLHTVSRLRGAQQAADTLPAADTGAEAAAPVSGATGHALQEETVDSYCCVWRKVIMKSLIFGPFFLFEQKSQNKLSSIIQDSNKNLLRDTLTCNQQLFI